ncbi:histidine kinase [Streptomyces sp. NPDC001889]
MTPHLRTAATALRAAGRALRADLLTTDGGPPPGAPRPRRSDWLPVYGVLLTLTAAVLLIVTVDQYVSGFGLGTAAGIALASLQYGALVAALFRPVPAWWTTLVATVAVTLLMDPGPGADAPYPWTEWAIAGQAGVLFAVALRARPRVAAETLVVSAVTGLLCGIAVSGDTRGAPVALMSLALSTAVGAALRGRQRARSELVAQEEITAGERARRTLLEERNRIARELHDVVAHHMSVISIQAQVAPHLTENPSDELRENLAGIRRSAVDALAELRRVLGVLRSEDALSQAVRHAPQPTLDRLDELFARVRATGLVVTARATGERRPLPPGVELSAYRIVQEALSNAMRHSPGAAVRVDTRYQPSGIMIRVTNSPPERPAPPTPGAGHGLLGMRERTAMLGGELACGATPDGGWEVWVTLPRHTAAQSSEETV